MVANGKVELKLGDIVVLKVCSMLLDNELEPDKKDKLGRTPLLESCLHGAIDCAKLLLEMEADPNVMSDMY